MQGQPNTYGCKTATLTVPAEYLEDMQTAIVREISSDSEMLRDNMSSPEDFASAADVLARDMRLLENLLTATGEVELTAEHDRRSTPLVHMLEKMVRLLSERLGDVAEYGPLPMGNVLEITEQLEWAAREAIRIDPQLGAMLSDRKAV